MNNANLSKFVDVSKAFVTKRSPEILTGIGIAGMVTTTVLAVKATPKALVLIGQAENEKERDLTAIETVKVAWKPYIPAIVTGTMSTVCLIGASSVNLRRNAALATAYKLSETAFAEYKDKVIETVGEKKEKIVKEKVAEERIKKNPVTKNDVIITGNGSTLCYDSLSGRYFQSDIESIKKAVNELNRRMVYDVYVSLNEFYDELDLDHTIMGDDLGWNLDNGLIEVGFSSHIADNGTPCIVIDFHVAPRYDYSKLS